MSTVRNMSKHSETAFRARRLAEGYTLDDLAKRCGVAKATIWRIEHGATPRPALRKELADLLGLDVADFERVAS